MRPVLLVAFLVTVLPAAGNAAGVARNDNFSVYVPKTSAAGEDQRFAEQVLQRAQQYRREISQEWLGEELPDGAGRSTIYVEFSSVADVGLTWAKDSPERRSHTIWLNTSPKLAIGETLKHEVAHSVFATKYPHPNRLPSWLEEGIASRYDEQTRQDAREQLLRSWVRTGRAAELAPVVESTDVRSFDEDSYAIATSLVSFLLTRGDGQTLLRFADDAQRSGWAAALGSHYGIESLAALQSQWQIWLENHFRTS